MTEYFTIEQLKQRGWTTDMVRMHLGKPDDLRPDPNGRLRKPIKLYSTDRVHTLEAGAAKADLGKLAEAQELAKRALSLKKKKLSR